MFIRLTYNKDVIYINVEYIEGLKALEEYTQIWLVDGDIIRVKQSPDEILKLIEEARNHENQG